MADQLVDPMNAFFLLILVPASLACGTWVLGPLVSTRRNSRGAWQCRLPDVLLLAVQLATGGAIACKPDDELGIGSELAGLAVLWSILALWWWMGVRVLSMSQIDDPFRRFVILGIVCPTIYCWPLIVLMANPLFLIFFVNFLLVIPLLGLAAVFWVCRAVVRWAAKPVSESRAQSFVLSRQLAPLRFAACGLVCALAITGATSPLWCGITIGPMFYKTHLRRFRTAMRYDADIPVIQAWLQSHDMTAIKKESYGEIVAGELPPCMSQLSYRVFLSPEGTLKLIWGGGFGHWGLEVAPRGTTMPPSSPREYHLPLADGAWVWHEIQ